MCCVAYNFLYLFLWCLKNLAKWAHLWSWPGLTYISGHGFWAGLAVLSGMTGLCSMWPSPSSWDNGLAGSILIAMAKAQQTKPKFSCFLLHHIHCYSIGQNKANGQTGVGKYTLHSDRRNSKVTWKKAQTQKRLKMHRSTTCFFQWFSLLITGVYVIMLKTQYSLAL